jgi:hypothetical protein
MEPKGSLPRSQVYLSLSIPSQRNPAHTPTSCSLKIHQNIIFPSTPGSPQWFLSYRFPHQNPVHASSLPHSSCMLRPSCSSRFYHPHSSGWEVQIMEFLIMKFFSQPCYLVPLRPKYSLQHPIRKHHQPMFFSQYQRPSFTPIKRTGKIIVLCILILKLLDRKLEHKRFCTEW